MIPQRHAANVRAICHSAPTDFRRLQDGRQRIPMPAKENSDSVQGESGHAERARQLGEGVGGLGRTVLDSARRVERRGDSRLGDLVASARCPRKTALPLIVTTSDWAFSCSDKSSKRRPLGDVRRQRSPDHRTLLRAARSRPPVSQDSA